MDMPNALLTSALLVFGCNASALSKTDPPVLSKSDPAILT